MVGEAKIDTVLSSRLLLRNGLAHVSTAEVFFAVRDGVKWFGKQQCYYDGSRSPCDIDHPAKA